MFLTLSKPVCHLISKIQRPDAQLHGNDPKKKNHTSTLNKSVRAEMWQLMARWFASVTSLSFWLLLFVEVLSMAINQHKSTADKLLRRDGKTNNSLGRVEQRAVSGWCRETWQIRTKWEPQPTGTVTEAERINEDLNFKLNQKGERKFQVDEFLINSGCACRSVNETAYGSCGIM